ncbi:hypothetical protein M758_UG187700 [Ceratodon purpureus]|nr:hypothetical protein M758_UG187700 [Ceratodon purpureus]
MGKMVFLFWTFMNANGEGDLCQVWLFGLFGSIHRVVPEFNRIIQKFVGMWVFTFWEGATGT